MSCSSRNTLASDVEITGSIKFSHDLIIDGKIDGEVISDGSLTIGENAKIGAGSVVNKDVPADTLAYGVPARHHPLPENISDHNLPELILPQTALFGAQSDETWRDE